MITPEMRNIAHKISEFASSHRILLTEAEALDLTGHILCDEMVEVMRYDPPDWHCIFWNYEVSNYFEIYSLCRSGAAALAAVTNHAEDEGHNIVVKIDVDGTSLIVNCGGELYARICRPEWIEPNPTTHRRLATLVSPLKIWEEQRLIEALSTLPAWQVEQHHTGFIWSMNKPNKPRTGQWLPALSFNGVPGAALEQNLLPMWPTPNAMAATLHQLLSERTQERLKLAHCQEALAAIHGAKSWQVLLARFRAYSFPQVSLQHYPNGAAVPAVRFHRGPVELLAWTYDLALQRKAMGESPLYVQVEWVHSFKISLTHRLVSQEELRQQISAKAPSPAAAGWDTTEHQAAKLRWEAAERSVVEKAEEWRDYGSLLDVIYPRKESCEAASLVLKELGYA